MPADHDTRPLGRTGIHVLPLGIGTNKWRRADRGAVLETYRTIHAGPCMIDTAEIYFSERVVGDCLRAGPTRAVIASKFLPSPGRTSPRRLMSALDGSLARLGLKAIDLYYVHYPLPLIDVGVFAEGLVEAVKSDKARKPLISTTDLDKIYVRIGTILAVEDVAHSEKLVWLRVDFGDHARSILVGMKKERPSPKEIEGRQRPGSCRNPPKNL
jgi:aryl-alcohol dehydrogenase-like predicted oxidoreductase